ncbi:hypothetical protein N7492_006861 [Penicillium capsulatum]|uniref:Uncharacterized protein n=1 Tax=Penicillium capsulatum TaxID=69766 RepID=A0A9W9I060_9EURO|nr:hypothetical protein N7492_006861 [Penicillium capsulatum]KAJ6116695.1 hypothetical protein N7512_006420 [Penicillium capsulatum]
MHFHTIFAAAMATMVPFSAAVGNAGKLFKNIVEVLAPGLDHQHNANIDTRDALVSDVLRRDDLAQQLGLPHQVVEDCRREGKDAPVEITKEPSGGLKAQRLPAVCTTFATSWAEDTSPFACGTDCIQYSGLTDDQVQRVINAAQELMTNAQIK